jgi:hypothetical protein
MCLVAGAFAGPALAGKVKKGSYDVVAPAVYPMDSAIDDTGCFNSPETASKVVHAYKTPGTGKLTVKLSGFQGDWDLYVADAKGNLMAESTGDQTSAMAGQGGDPSTETIVMPVRGKVGLKFVTCNWAGGPTAHVDYKYVLK